MGTKTEETIIRTAYGTASRLDGLLEAAETVLDAAKIRLRPECQPDGDWVRESDRPGRKRWRRRNADVDELVVLESNSLTGDWRIWHQTPQGTLEEVTDESVSREVAYYTAEEYMADLSSVTPRHRTGRTADQ